MKGLSSIAVYRSTIITVLILSATWNAPEIEGCLSGRYGRYENWPSAHDWEELLLLLTGKWPGGGGWGGWGWSSGNSLGYDSYGHGGGGSFGSSLFSSGYSGGGGGGSSYFSSPASYGSGYGGSVDSSGVNSQKLKAALNSYFAKNKHKPVTSSNFGSGGVGQSYSVPNSGPGPSYGNQQSLHDSEPALQHGPPYDDDIIGGWPGGGFSPPSYHDNHTPPKDEHSPSYDQFSNQYGPPNDGPPSYQDNHHGPPDHIPPKDEHHSEHGPSYDQYPNQYGPPNDGPPSYHDDHHGPPKDEDHGHPESRPHYDNSFNKNQFEADRETFGGHFDKRRRQGRRRWFSAGQAGLPTKPKVPAIRALRHRQPRRRMHRQRQRNSRRKIDTSFGGYKVDHSRLRFG